MPVDLTISNLMVRNTDSASPSPIKMSTADIMLFIGIEAMNANDDKIKLAYEQVQRNNRFLQNLNKVLAEAQKHTEKGGDIDYLSFDYTDPDTGEVRKGYGVKDFLRDNGIIDAQTNGTLSKEKWAAIAQGIKGASDATGGNNQIDMMKLQSTLNKQNEMSQMVSNNMSKINQMMMAIIGNMR